MLVDLLTYARGSDGFITTAAPYLKEMQACLSGDGVCPVKLFSLESADTWTKMLNDADDRLTYCDPEGVVKSFSENGWDEDWKVPAKSVLVYDAVLSTSQKDRDGDIVRTKGMQLEESMPLLWQHVWSQPIGKMLRTVDQNENNVVCKYAIADTELGRDAAVLVSMGALRKSHGFYPLPGQIEPLEVVKRADGSQVAKGFDIKGCYVYESSLVSVPANAGAKVLRVFEKEFDAVCKAVSEKKLQSEIATRWAKGLYDNRQRVFKGADLEPAKTDAATEQPKPEKTSEHPQPQAKTPEATEVPKGHGWLKSFADSGVKMMGMPEALPGSFEAVQRSISRKIEDYLETKDIDVSDYEYVTTVGTFADSAVVCIRNWRKDTERCYRVMWQYGDDGKVMLTGDPETVEIEASIVAKAMRDRESWTKEMKVSDHANQIMAKAFSGSLESEDAINTLENALRVLKQTRKESEPNPLAELFG